MTGFLVRRVKSNDRIEPIVLKKHRCLRVSPLIHFLS
jgi:hypothetical protein